MKGPACVACDLCADWYCADRDVEFRLTPAQKLIMKQIQEKRILWRCSDCFYKGEPTQGLHCASCDGNSNFEQEKNMTEDKAEMTAKILSMVPVSHQEYMRLSDAIDKHSKTLMGEKGEEYSMAGDFLAMENRLAGMIGDTPEYVSLIMAGKHITSLGIILEKQKPEEIKLEKWDERIRDAINLMKICSAFIHAKQNDFTLHLGKGEQK